MMAQDGPPPGATMDAYTWQRVEQAQRLAQADDGTPGPRTAQEQ